MKDWFVKFMSLWVVALWAVMLPRAVAAEATAPRESAQYHNAQALAEARIGRWSRALAELRQAETYAPLNPDVQANLRLVRTKLDQPAAPNPLRSLVRLPLNLWAAVTLLAAWLFVAIGVTRQRRPQWREPLSKPLWIVLALGVASAGLMGLTLLGRRLSPDAVVIAKDAILRQGPVDAAKPVGTIADGSEVRIRREHRGWYEIGPVRPGAPALGWLPPGHLVVVDGEAGRTTASR